MAQVPHVPGSAPPKGRGASQPLERLYLPEKVLPGPDTIFLCFTEAPVTRGDPPAFPLLLLPAEDECPGEAARRSLSACLCQGCTGDGGQPLRKGNGYVLGDDGSLPLPSREAASPAAPSSGCVPAAHPHSEMSWMMPWGSSQRLWISSSHVTGRKWEPEDREGGWSLVEHPELLWDLKPQLPSGLFKDYFDLVCPLTAGSARGFLPDAATLHHGWLPGLGSGLQSPERSDHL